MHINLPLFSPLKRENIVFGGFPEIKYFDVFKPSILIT